jgi:predicted ester cyclase
MAGTAGTRVAPHEAIWVNGLNRGDLSAADEAFAPDCVVHITGFPEPIRGVEAWKEIVRGFLAAFPDLQFTIEETVTCGDTVVSRWHARGTHSGPFGSIAPTGRTISIDGLILDHIEKGKVVERWEQFDQPVILHQIGAQ